MQNGLPVTSQTMHLKAGETAKRLKIDEIFQNEKEAGVINLLISQDCQSLIASTFSSLVMHKLIVFLIVILKR